MRLTPAVVELVVGDMSATVSRSTRHGGMRYAVVLDPDGTPVDLFAAAA